MGLTTAKKPVDPADIAADVFIPPGVTSLLVVNVYANFTPGDAAAAVIAVGGSGALGIPLQINTRDGTFSSTNSKPPVAALRILLSSRLHRLCSMTASSRSAGKPPATRSSAPTKHRSSASTRGPTRGSPAATGSPGSSPASQRRGTRAEGLTTRPTRSSSVSSRLPTLAPTPVSPYRCSSRAFTRTPVESWRIS